MARKPTPASLFAPAAGASAPRRSSSQMVSVRLPDDLLHRLADAGRDEGLSLSDTIRVVLERGLRASPPNRKDTP